MGTRCVILIGPAAHKIARHRNSRQHGTLLGEQNSGLSSWLYDGLKVIECHTHQGIAQLVSIRVLIVQVVGSNPKCSFLKVLTPIYRWVHLLVSIIVVTDWWTSTWHVTCRVRGERELYYVSRSRFGERTQVSAIAVNFNQSSCLSTDDAKGVEPCCLVHLVQWSYFCCA